MTWQDVVTKCHGPANGSLLYGESCDSGLRQIEIIIKITFSIHALKKKHSNNPWGNQSIGCARINSLEILQGAPIGHLAFVFLCRNGRQL